MGKKDLSANTFFVSFVEEFSKTTSAKENDRTIVEFYDKTMNSLAKFT